MATIFSAPICLAVVDSLTDEENYGIKSWFQSWREECRVEAAGITWMTGFHWNKSGSV
jgi:hypothetical protein